MGFSWFVCKLCDSAAYMKIFQDKADLDEHLRTDHVQIKNEASCSSTIKINKNENNVNKLHRATTVRLETMDTNKCVTPKTRNLEDRKPNVNPSDSSQNIVDAHSSSTNNNFKTQEDDTENVHDNNKSIPSTSSLKNSYDDNKVKPEEIETVFRKIKRNTSSSSSHSTFTGNNDFEAHQNETILEESQSTSSSPSTSAETIKLEKEKCYTCDICKKQYLQFNQFWLHLNSHDVYHSAKNNPNCKNTTAENNLRFLAVKLKKLDLRPLIRQKSRKEGKPIVNASDSDEIMILYQNNQDEPNKCSKNNSNHSQAQKNQLPSTSKNHNKDTFKIHSTDYGTDEEVTIISPNKSPTTDKLETRFNCDHCKQEFLYFNSFWRHLKSHNLKNSRKEADETNDSDPVTTPVQLEQKSTLPKARSIPEIHISRIPRKIRIPKRTTSYKSKLNEKIKHYTCKICQKTYKSRGGLSTHKLGTHSIILPYSCKHCQEKFSRQQHLVVHVRTVHNTTDYYFCCNKCGKKLVRSTAMERHKRLCVVKQSGRPKKLNIQSKESSFININNGKIFGAEVSLCDYKASFDQQSTQVSHHVCNICGKTFKNWLSWEGHKRLHKDDRIHKCQYCESMFTSHSRLVSHVHLEHRINEPARELENGFDNEDRVDFPEFAGHSPSPLMKKPRGRRTQTCQVCHKTFKSPAFLRIHLKRKLDCDIGWNHLKIIEDPKTEKKNMNNTYKNKGDDEILLRVPAIDRTFNSFSNKDKIQSTKLQIGGSTNKTPEQSSKNFSCNVCNRIFKTKANLGCHRRTHMKTSLSTGVTKNTELFQNQQIQTNRTINPLPSEELPRPTKLKACSTKIVEKCSTRSKMKFSCEFCPRTFGYARVLANHRKSHIKGNVDFNISARTPIISNRCTNPSPSDTHKFSTADNCTKISSKTYQKEKSRFSCSYCRKLCTSLNSLNNHTRLHTGQKPFGCKFCDNKYASREAALVHTKIKHPRPFPCVLCKNAFKTFDDLIKHNMKYHTEEKIVPSSSTEFITNKTTLVKRNKFNTRKHNLQAVTAKKKLHQCAYCPKRLSTASSLKLHTRIHTGERPYVCPYCKKSFVIRQHLIDHVRLHTGQKPFNCKVCGKAYPSLSSALTHTSRKHTKPHACDLCNDSFGYRYALISHMNKNHAV